MGELLRRLGCTVDYDADGGHGRHRRARPSSGTRPTTTWSAGSGRRSACSGPLLARCGQAEVAHAGRRRDRLAGRSTSTSPGSTKLGAELENEHGYIVGRGAEGADRRDRLARLPERRRHRERADGGGAGRRHDGHRQRGPRAGDRRPRARCSQQMGAQIDGIGTSTLTIEGVDRLSPTDPRDRAGPHRRRHLGVRRGDDPGRRDGAQRPARAPRDRAGQAAAGRGASSRASTTASGSCMDAPADGGRRRDAALPGAGHRPAAAGDGAQLRSPTAPP